MSKLSPADLARLRHNIGKLQGPRRVAEVLPFDISAIDCHLTNGGLALGALHEIAGFSSGTVDGATAGYFAAGIAARTEGKVLWCTSQPDLFAPGLAHAGLAAHRVIHVKAEDDTAVLAACEEGLRYGALGAVVGEVSRLSMMASRRLQLAAEGASALVLIVRRWRREKDAVQFASPTAAATRWRITAMPSGPLAVPGIGKARWYLELLRCKGGHTSEFHVEACDGQGRLALSASLADRPAKAADSDKASIRRIAS